MENRKLTTLILVALIGVATVWALSKKESDRGTLKESTIATDQIKPEHLIASEPKTVLETEVRQVEASLRTSESYESEFRSFPSQTLRDEVAKIDSALDPTIETSNKRALSIDERAQVADGLRKKQALLKILIDRQVDESKARVRL